MTATFAPFGLQAARRVGSVVNNGARSTKRIQSLTTATIYKGQPVAQTANGVIDIYVSAAITTGANTIGVFDGCRYTDPVTGRLTDYPYWPGGTSATDAVAFVIDDPFATFFVQANTSLSAIDAGALAGFTTASYTSGTTQWAQSLAALNQASLGTADLALRILGLADFPGNSWNDAAPIVEVMFARHAYMTSAGI